MPTLRKLGRPIDAQRQADRRAAILNAAALLFARDGFASADTQELADSLQVAKGTIYHYFPSKQALFFAAVDRGIERLKEAITSHIAHDADPLDQLVEAMRAYLRFFEQHPELVELLVLERAQFKERKSSYFAHHHRDQDCRWHDLLAGLIAAGRLRRVPIERILNVLGDLLYGTMFTNHLSGRARSCDEQVRDIFDVVFIGLLTDAERNCLPT